MRLLPTERPFIGEIDLPISKSIANRYLIISAIAGESLKLPQELPEDVQVLQAALNSDSDGIDIGMAGTAMRFLTAFYAVQKDKQVTVTGDERMQKRPISELVNALQDLGADISYVKQDGYPPLRITGKRLSGGEISISGSVSSQFISALMMIAPTMERGLKINLKGEVLSWPYIKLTADCMAKCGVNVTVEKDTIFIHSGMYQIPSFQLQSDWSAASYFYALACANQGSKLLLKGLKLDSSQGDSILSEWFARLGVSSIQKETGVEISSSGAVDFPSTLDFKGNPDLAQTFAFLSAMLGVSFKLTGLNNLRIKETDRIDALKTELEKLGIVVEVEDNSITLGGSIAVQEATVSTYNDHRMAMSGAVLSVQLSTTIENPGVVAKSFPNFWNELKAISA